MKLRRPLLLVSCIAIAGCATSSSNTGRSQVVVPTPVSQVYSEVDMQIQLAAAAAPTEDMYVDQCLMFEYQRHVRKVAERLVATALRLYPDIEEREIRFRFDVAPSADAGVLSNAGGNIVVLQGTGGKLPDPVLAFVLAREMGHVIGRHHDENSAASVMFSVLGQALFPAAALIKGLSAVLPTTVAGAAATASAVSYLGATALKSTYRFDHLREAEQIAFRLMVESDWDLFAVAEESRGLVLDKGDAAWLRDLKESLRRLDLLAFGPRRRLFQAGPYNTARPVPASLAATVSDARNQ